MAEHDRITELRIQGLRTLADVKLPLSGLTVLIGENGVGKSSIVEACELLRRAPRQTFIDEFHSIHEGFRSLLRLGQTHMTLGVRIEGGGDPIEYAFTLARQGNETVVTQEELTAFPGEAGAIDVLQAATKPWERHLPPGLRGRASPRDSSRLSIATFGSRPPHEAIARVVAALTAIDVQLPFETVPRWAANEQSQRSFLRGSVVLEPASRLTRYGRNLPNVFHALQNEKSDAHWRQTMDYVRLGLGEDVESINTRADPSGGAVALLLKRRGIDEQEPAFLLSEGQLAYLAFVALFRLEAPCSLLVFDEPELHLHPQLMMRVLGFFEAMAKTHPVLLATHSDRLLDGLSDPAESARLCELDEHRATRLLKPDPEALASWLERYRGLGDLRSEGYESAVFTKGES